MLAVASAWVAGALLLVTAWMTSAVWNLGELQLLSATLVLRSFAVAVLAAHYFARHGRVSAVASAGYAAAVVASIIVLLVGPSNPDGRAQAEVLFGLVLVGIGVWLLIAGRKWGSPFSASLRAPAPLVIAAGGMYVLMSVVCITGIARANPWWR